MRTRKSRRRGRNPSLARPVPPAAPADRPAFPLGNPHTDWVAVPDAQGTCWLAYVEPAPPEQSFRRSAAVIPGRRLRFDSLERSVAVAPVPAGAPFLSELRLQRLLADAVPLMPEVAPATRPSAAARTLGAIDWAGSFAAGVAALRDAVAGQWAATVGFRRLCTRGLVHLVAPAALLLIVLWEALLVRSRARG
jgi:hypothetical protein